MCHLIGGVVAGHRSQKGGDESHAGTHLDARLGKLGFSLLQEIPAAYGYHEGGADDPRGGDGVGELVDGEWRECHIQERSHLEAHGVGIEFLTYWVLHPGVGYENPPGRNGGAKSGKPGGG